MNQILVIVLCFVANSALLAQGKVEKEGVDVMLETYMKANKNMIDSTKPMIDFFLKYDEKDSLKAPNQSDFDQMLNQMGIMDEVKNDQSGLTKEDVFQFINAYINADKSIGKEGEKPDKPVQESQLDQELKKAEKQFDEAKPELEGMLKEAEKEFEKLQNQSNFMSYEDFRKRAKQRKPDLSESEIRDAYNEVMKVLGNPFKTK
ncbi:hypothetical protein [Labilibaculum euxinus]|uniref:Uncharacterized protein n=1 Tax=Labilibaculum euxinus TaxID=2686357 RepID=A0A7M4D1B8_9BACT|nr:hypothetical protein [Labilibaculum euxinus]MUP36447.1 hypothetical protein [Labilibaculum euxinus]MVB05652.1 hypothetical protein [Labilibaculum euxinus]